MDEHKRVLPEGILSPEELALLKEKVGELTGSVHRLEENFKRLQGLDSELKIKGGNENG